MTFMGYMNSVTAGGFTVFPSLGLYVQPTKGDALFWMTERNDAVIDTGCRIFFVLCFKVNFMRVICTKFEGVVNLSFLGEHFGVGGSLSPLI